MLVRSPAFVWIQQSLFLLSMSYATQLDCKIKRKIDLQSSLECLSINFVSWCSGESHELVIPRRHAWKGKQIKCTFVVNYTRQIPKATPEFVVLSYELELLTSARQRASHALCPELLGDRVAPNDCTFWYRVNWHDPPPAMNWPDKKANCKYFIRVATVMTSYVHTHTLVYTWLDQM